MAKAKTATKAAATAKAETVSTRNLAVQLAEKHEMSNKQAVLVMDDVILTAQG